MRTVVITIGLPASGKSTWAKQQLVQEPKRWKRINRDDIRAMVDNGWNPAGETFITIVQESTLRSALDEGFDVIIDNTSLPARVRKRLHEICAQVGDVKIIERMFQTPMQTCLDRNATRAEPVPLRVIEEMAKKHGGMLKRGPAIQEFYYPPVEFKDVVAMDQNAALPKAILCDLDGTLALIGDRSPFDATECDVKDKPNVPVIECVKAMHAQGVQIIFMSGRMAKDRDASIRFIEKWVRVPANYAFSKENDERPQDNPIPYQLFMRATGDMRKDNIIKRELFDAHVRGKFNVLFVLDDRDQVVNGWRTMGLSCFQVAPGNF